MLIRDVWKGRMEGAYAYKGRIPYKHTSIIRIRPLYTYVPYQHTPLISIRPFHTSLPYVPYKHTSLIIIRPLYPYVP